MTRKDKTLKDWSKKITYNYKQKISSWNNSQKSWTKNAIDPLRSQMKLEVFQLELIQDNIQYIWWRSADTI